MAYSESLLIFEFTFLYFILSKKNENENLKDFIVYSNKIIKKSQKSNAI